MLYLPALPLPRLVHLDPDDPAAVFELLQTGREQGHDGALLTIVAQEGGGRRPVGTQMAVLDDGRYCGYLSGGCVEAAAATEALVALGRGENTVLHFGRGSPFSDIALPCGGAIHIRVDVGIPVRTITECLSRSADRKPYTLAFRPSGPVILDEANGDIGRDYRPTTRLLLVGEGPELPALARLAMAARWQVKVALSRLDRDGDALAQAGVWTTDLLDIETTESWCDDFTAAVVFLHEREREADVLEQLLDRPGFYLGAIGSATTHSGRLALLRERGVAEANLARIHGPVGAFGPCRDATTLAISVVAEIAQERLSLER